MFKIYNIYFKISVQIFILTEETSSLSFARKFKSIIETEAISSLKNLSMISWEAICILS